jgi:hypothetical protein
VSWEEYDESDEMDEVKNPVEARAYALDKLESAVRSEYKHFFCQMCRVLMPCGCDELSDYDVATQAKYDAHNTAIDELLVVIERMRGS